MSHRCPTCGQKVKKPVPLRITRANDPAEWRAWIRHWGANGKTYFIEYWTKKGYADVPTRFPPDHLQLEPAVQTASLGASSHE